VFEVITQLPSNTIIGNFSLPISPVTGNPNQAFAQLPSTFNASQYLTTGNYTATFTYVPSSNFTQPTNLVINFYVVVRAPTLVLAALPHTLTQGLM
jgi:hypothetical protein